MQLSLCSRVVQLEPHELVSTRASRLEGLTDSASNTTSFWKDFSEQAADADEYLGLRWYRTDPLPAIQYACDNSRKTAKSTDDGQKIKFVDWEFPVHDQVHLKVTPAPNQDVVECIPGVITSSNCRDFQTVPNRIPRIQHFINKADRSNGGWNWARASSLYHDDCSLFSSPSHSIDPRNVLQGKVGNCGFCSGFASVAAGWPDVLKRVFGENSQLCLCKNGAVSVLLYPRGQPRYLLLDDYILCKNETDNDCVGRKTLSPSMHSLLEQDLWVRLLEKAFVKVQGSYASLDGYYKYNSLYRHPARAIQLLTGAPVAIEVHYSTSDTNTMYNILHSTQGKFAKVVHCRKRIDGLIPNHGYSLLWIGKGEEGERWVCLRNPHGKGSYKGYGFDGSLIYKTDDRYTLPKCLTVCCNTGRIVWQQSEGSECHPSFALCYSNDDNGIFFLEFSRFIEFFPITTLVGPIRSTASPTVTSINADIVTGDSGTDFVYEIHRRNLSDLGKILASIN